MIDTASGWISAITAAALISAAAMALTPKGIAGKAVKLACGAMTAIVLLGPIKKFDYADMARFMTQLRLDGSELSCDGAAEAERVTAAIIQSEAQAYILDKAAQLGARAEAVRVDIASRDRCLYPCAAEVTGTFTEFQKDELSLYIEQEFGIPGEKQYWYTSDEKSGT